MPKIKEHIAQCLKTLPLAPGVYQFYDKQDRILYVGKTKKLKKRVSSYFHKGHLDYAKTRVLVKKIERIEYILVESEMDALLLENSLIKKLQPRYNVLLKDDKTYPWICIKKERFPRVFSIRNLRCARVRSAMLHQLWSNAPPTPIPSSNSVSQLPALWYRDGHTSTPQDINKPGSNIFLDKVEADH